MKSYPTKTIAIALLQFVVSFTALNQISAQTVSVSRVGGWVSQGIGSVNAIAVSGNYAYLATGAGGLQVINITNAALPVKVGSFLGSGSANDVVVSGNHAFVADAIDGLHVLTITNPAAPVRIGGYLTNLTKRIAVSTNHAYLLRGGGNSMYMDVIDTSNPASPVWLGIYNFPNPTVTGQNYPAGIGVFGSIVYFSYGGTHSPEICNADRSVTASLGGIEFVDVSNANNPVRKGGISGKQYFGLAHSGNYLYASQGYIYQCPPSWPSGNGGFTSKSSGLSAFNIGNLTNIVTTGYFATDTNNWPSDVTIFGKYAYLVGSTPRFQVFDITNPTNLLAVGGYDINGPAYRVKAAGDYAYLANGTLGLEILCINCPSLTAEYLGNSLAVRWPTNATNYMLERTLSLSLPLWQTVSGTPQVLGEVYQLNLPATNSSAFFRLRRP